MELHPLNPVRLAERLSVFPMDMQLTALTTCACCREKHSGWCISELCDGDARCAAETALDAASSETQQA